MALILWLIYWCGVVFVWYNSGVESAKILALMYILFVLLQINGRIGG